MTENTHTPDADILAGAIAKAIHNHWDGQLREADCRAAAEAVMEAIGAPEMLAALRVASRFVGASAFNLGQSPSRNSRRSAQDYRDAERQIDAAIAKATGALTSGNRTDG